MAEQAFYSEVLTTLLRENFLRKDDRVLVVCGAIADKEVFEDLGFSDVTITNLDERQGINDFIPYAWSLQDAENLGYQDEEFDFVVVNGGLHHCRSPHRALQEMYRVARKGILAFEARDNLIIKASIYFGISEKYEISGVVGNGGDLGGLRNTCIPNYVYRWTEQEVIKSISSFSPHVHHRFRFFYSLSLPLHILTKKHPVLKPLVTCIASLSKLFTIIFPRQCNQIGFLIYKPEIPRDLHPWLQVKENEVIFKQDSL